MLPDRFLNLAMTAAGYLIVMLLTACASLQPGSPGRVGDYSQSADKRNEIVMFAVSLMENGYQFGGNNPDTGMDCSGMVSYIYRQSIGMRLPHNAEQIAQMGKPVQVSELQPGDLVFFNTNGHDYSHVGIYIGDNRFIHAPKRNGKVRTDALNSGYFRSRLVAARAYL